jgi:hypothetical protein
MGKQERITDFQWEFGDKKKVAHIVFIEGFYFPQNVKKKKKEQIDNFEKFSFPLKWLGKPQD